MRTHPKVSRTPGRRQASNQAAESNYDVWMARAHLPRQLQLAEERGYRCVVLSLPMLRAAIRDQRTAASTEARRRSRPDAAA